MSTITKYIEDNVLCRCGQAVTRLAESGLIEWPPVPNSEVEINEWWLVTDALAAKLRAAQLPVIRFGELNLWGRSSTAPHLQDDLELVGAIMR